MLINVRKLKLAYSFVVFLRNVLEFVIRESLILQKFRFGILSKVFRELIVLF
jgi:hypothetical protein